jgi:hypothetical protein
MKCVLYCVVLTIGGIPELSTVAKIGELVNDISRACALWIVVHHHFVLVVIRKHTANIRSKKLPTLYSKSPG